MTNDDKVASISNAANLLFWNRNTTDPDTPTAQLEKPSIKKRRKGEEMTVNEAGFSSSDTTTKSNAGQRQVRTKI